MSTAISSAAGEREAREDREEQPTGGGATVHPAGAAGDLVGFVLGDPAVVVDDAGLGPERTPAP